ncbi:MAG: hypothetical protein MI799_21665, partial [Desulfobacterales bacterium]|nr:hypothetical protein [Desulfobacterales bacterium]
LEWDIGFDFSTQAMGDAFAALLAGKTSDAVSVDLDIDVAGFAALSGSFGIQKDGGDIKIAGLDVTAQIQNSSFSAGVFAAQIALILKSDGSKIVYAAGQFGLSGGDVLDAAGVAAMAYNDTGLDVIAQDISVAGITISLPDIADNARWLSGSGLSFRIRSFVSLSGDFGIEINGGVLSAVSGNVTAQLEAGGFKVGVSDGALALVLNDDGSMAMTASGALALAGVGFENASGVQATVIYNDTTTDYDAENQRISINGIQADLTAALNTTSVYVTGLDVEFNDFVSLSGDFAFELVGVTPNLVIKVRADNVSALAAAGGFSAGVSNADFAMLVNEDGSAAFQVAGGFEFQGQDMVVAAAADAVIEYNDTGADLIDEPVAIDGFLDLDLNLADGLRRIRVNALDLVAGDFFRVTGDFLFEKNTAAIRLSDNAWVDVGVDVLTLGGSNITAFAGLNSGRANAVGFNLTGVDFALAMFGEQGGAGRTWTSLFASASGAGFTGNDDIVFTASQMAVELNRSSGDEVVDFD